MIDTIKVEAETRMHKSVENMQHELAKLRTGRAHPGVLAGVTVLYYGQATPLDQVAHVVIKDASTLSVTPWEKSMVQAIENAIIKANLGLNPTTLGNIVLVPLPPLTEERRKDLVRQARDIVEGGRVAVRNVRRDANNQVKELLKAKEVSEDDARRCEEAIQKLTDKTMQDIDKLLSSKEQDLMQV